MHSLAVYLVSRVLGGPEEGGWYYEQGELCDAPELIAFGTTFSAGHEDRAIRSRDEVQAHLNRDWNIGGHARSLDSVLSVGRYEARVHDGWPPTSFPQERPQYE